MSEPLYITFVDAARISGLEKDALRKRIARTIGADKIIKQGRSGYLDITLYRDLLSEQPDAQDPEAADVQLYQRDRAGVLVPATPRDTPETLAVVAEPEPEPEPELEPEADDPEPVVTTPEAIAGIAAAVAAVDDVDEESIDPSELDDVLPDDVDSLLEQADETEYQDDTLTISTVSIPLDGDPDATRAMPVLEDEPQPDEDSIEGDYMPENEPDIEDDEDADGNEDYVVAIATPVPVAAIVEVSDDVAHARACRQVLRAAIPDHDELDRYIHYLKAPQRSWLRRWITKTEQPPPSWWRSR